MSRASDAANAVVNACEQVLAMYGIQSTREQSRVIMVEGAAGRMRPMYFGKWTDDFGKAHASGRADLLARPRLHLGVSASDDSPIVVPKVVTIPLWIECKSGKGTLSPDQRAFRAWVTSNGDEYLLIHDDIRPLIEWIESRGIKKEPKSIIHAEPMNVAAVNALPCRHCDKPKSEHLNKILACPTKAAVGRVWSPRLAPAVKA